MKRGEDTIDTFFDMLGHLYCLGSYVNMANVNRLSDPGRKNAHLLVDLPEYPFNHSMRYWQEGHNSKRYRLDPRRKLDLLGKPVDDFNYLEGRWRNRLRISEMP